jgi:hypothetical protein
MEQTSGKSRHGQPHNKFSSPWQLDLPHEMFMPQERAKLYNEIIFLVPTSTCYIYLRVIGLINKTVRGKCDVVWRCKTKYYQYISKTVHC